LNLGNDTTQQTQRTFACTNLLWTCYGLATGKLLETGVMDFVKSCYGEVANLLWTC